MAKYSRVSVPSTIIIIKGAGLWQWGMEANHFVMPAIIRVCFYFCIVYIPIWLLLLGIVGESVFL